MACQVATHTESDSTTMIELIGSTYCYQGQQLCEPEIIVIRDHHYNEDLACFPVAQLLINSQCDPKQHALIFDHVLQHDDVLTNYNLIYFPSFMARENSEFVAQGIVTDWHHKTHTFNFMINKPRPHRIELLKLIQQHGLDNYVYSLAWRNNTVNSIAVTDYRFGSETVMDRGVKNGSFRNAHTYQALLQKTVFEPSCISLITEPVYYERETIVTEKTLMAMWAGTIPIWVGGWGIPQWLQDHGFDIFDDLVDHSYQHLPDPAQRVNEAIKRNLHLLQNLDLAQQAVHHNQPRLLHNLSRLESKYFVQLCREILHSYSGPVQNTLIKMLADVA